MMSAFLRRFVPWTGATLLLVAISAPGLAQEKKYKPFVVTAPDGVFLFIHGFSQASLSWQRQVESDLAKEFRMITYTCVATATPTSRWSRRSTRNPRPGRMSFRQ